MCVGKMIGGRVWVILDSPPLVPYLFSVIILFYL
jgi:hypothetical protein